MKGKEQGFHAGRLVRVLACASVLTGREKARELLPETSGVRPGPIGDGHGQSLSNRHEYSEPDNNLTLMGLKKTEYLLSERWWVTVLGCLAFAVLVGFALVAI